MKLSVQYKCNEFRPQIEEDLTRWGSKLERWLERYSADLVSLHAFYGKHSRNQSYVIRLNLRLPGATLHARAIHAEARFALRRAFDELENQINKHQSRLRKDYEWKRKRFRRPAIAEA